MFITPFASAGCLLRALVAAAALMIVAGVATVTFVVVGVAACGVALLRAIGRIIGRAAERNVPFRDHTTIEGVVVDSTVASPQLLRTDGDTR